MKLLSVAAILGAMLLNGCQKELTPKELVKDRTEISLTGAEELKKGSKFKGLDFSHFGVWEITEVQSATLTLDVPKTINSVFSKNKRRWIYPVA